VRVASTRDGVIASGNSVMVINLLDLYELTGEESWLTEASWVLSGLSSRVRRSPRSTALATVALERFLKHHPDRISRTAAAPPSPPGPPDPVKVTASSRTVSVSADTPGRVDITLTIEEGYHVNAHDPGLAELTGIGVKVVGRGLEVDAEYPDGDPFTNKLFEDDLLVHTGTVTIPLTLRQTSAWQGRPRLVLIYQVCTDQVCLPPVRVVLPVTINK
jgi:hypothetical protein